MEVLIQSPRHIVYKVVVLSDKHYSGYHGHQFYYIQSHEIQENIDEI